MPLKRSKTLQIKRKTKQDTQTLIRQQCDALKRLLLRKNKAYGDSALNPVRIFSKADSKEGIKIRIDDKLSRIAYGKATDKIPENTLEDLVGYLILIMIAQKLKKKKKVK